MNPQTRSPAPALPRRPAVVAGTPPADLEGLVERLEESLAALGQSLRLQDPEAIEGHAQRLHQALERALQGFQTAARQGGLPAPLRHRLMRASGQVAAQRESMVRATVALDRAMDALMPREAPSLYGARGWNGASAGSGQLLG
ncbi:hypothetical protein [Leptothrix discophora]|uniref:Flagellar protein FlgN n=1 Tax=Leptothrix discophora TaxID=89 RepID=A0ABT9FYN4_LEPDI|nr:hypothetical protein [Leptothrix discophora]MDP4299132.1 hypothetical protein [Leptothrix discophora]